LEKRKAISKRVGKDAVWRGFILGWDGGSLNIPRNNKIHQVEMRMIYK